MADRDASGKFVKGAKIGGARPGSGRKPLIRREILDSVVSESDWREIYAAILVNAKAGDLKSAEFLDARRFGRAPEATDEERTVEIPQINVTFHAPPVLPPASQE